MHGVYTFCMQTTVSSASMGTNLFQHSTAQAQVFVHPPCAVCYLKCALQMTLTMAMVTTTTMTTSVATMAMSMATTTLVVDLLQQQLQLPQAESALAAAVELHETNVLKIFLALVAALFGCLGSAVYLMIQWC